MAYALTIQPEMEESIPYNLVRVGNKGDTKNVSVPMMNMVKKNKREYFFIYRNS